jgi:hypothetical protein
MMKACLLATAAAAVLLVPTAFAHAQDIKQAERPGAVSVGAEYSNTGTDEYKQRIQGFSIYSTFDLRDALGLEADAHLLTIKKVYGYSQSEYLLGPRYIYHYGRYAPYAKILIGIGKTSVTTGTEPGTPGTYIAASFGGGLDIHMKQFHNKLTIRAIDIERQDWLNFKPNGLTPSVFSAGVAFQVFQPQ